MMSFIYLFKLELINIKFPIFLITVKKIDMQKSLFISEYINTNLPEGLSLFSDTHDKYKAKCCNGKGNQASYICFSKKCLKNALICQQTTCQCNIIHKNCFTMKISQFIQKIQNKILEIDPYIDYHDKRVDDFIDMIIDEASKVKEQFKKIAQQKFKYSLLSQNQKIIFLKLKQNEVADINGQYCNQLFMQMDQQIDMTLQKLLQQQFEPIQQIWQDVQNICKIQLQNLAKQLNSWMFVPKKSLPIKQDNVISRSNVHKANKISNILQGRKDCQNLFKLCQPLKIKQLKLLFKASQHNFSARQFHKKCDGIQHTLTLIKTNFDKIIGAYTKCKWQSTGGSAGDGDGSSFLFSLANLIKFKNINPNQTVFNYQQYGPTFGGAHDLHVPNSSNIKDSCYANIGYSYQNDEGYFKDQNWKKNIIGGDSSRFSTKQYQIYAIKFV